MPKKQSFFSTLFNKKNTIDVLFYFSFLATIIVSLLMNKEELLYVLPLTIIIIIIKYLSLTKKKARPLFIFALLTMLASDVLSLYSFEKYFAWTAILTSTSLICYTLSLKKYLNKSKLRSILSLSVLLSVLLISYVLYTVLDLLVLNVSDNQLYFTFLCSISLIIYIVTTSIIYINDNYKNGIIILTSGIFTFIQMTLIIVNEFLYFAKAITVIAIICHILAVYLLMNFVAKTKVIKPEDIVEKYI
ncbi:hypothetical protein [Ulvibacter litoralis]|uniref:YhhN-like protein n=1 Tax=Ulvibacter litoralis TaxID=227084 RepID=A0A1G7FH25_9FLAO|nr:hypothetical protein [Ulvibacter litoralis]GHC51153.1 hypothetical protein GCM10008083_13460 [Ulvibacter litoralis]SDE75236.1 hypothetical protein SAMN05421855_102561 [Ulvibacter litoralis]